jgi:hypothetical protein
MFGSVAVGTEAVSNKLGGKKPHLYRIKKKPSHRVGEITKSCSWSGEDLGVQPHNAQELRSSLVVQ